MSKTIHIQKWHPAAEAYPMMSGEDYARLKASVMKHGVLKPIDVYCGTAFPEFIGVGIDGRNRMRAAAECGKPCPVRMLVDANIGGSITDYIASVNSARRHEDAGYAVEAAKRKAANGGDKVSAQKTAQDLQKTLENPARADEEKIPHPLRREQSRAMAAAACDVNERYVQDAKKLFLEAPALFEKVKVGTLKLPVAMAALKRKSEDPAAWSQLLEGAISMDEFNARFEKAAAGPRRKRTARKEGVAQPASTDERRVSCPMCRGQGSIDRERFELGDRERYCA